MPDIVIEPDVSFSETDVAFTHEYKPEDHDKYANEAHKLTNGDVHHKNSEKPLLETKENTNGVTKPTTEDKCFWWKLTIIFLILDLLLLAAILIFSLKQNCIMCKQIKQSDLCLPCTDVYLTTDDISDNIHNFDKRDGNICCASNGSSVETIVSKFTEKKMRRKLATDSFTADQKNGNKLTFSPSSAHLKLLNTHISTDRLLWDSSSTGSYLGKDIIYKEGQLTVNKPGIYYLYSQLIFRDDKTRQNSSRYMNHELYRIRRTDVTEKLLETTQSGCESRDGKGHIPSYLGAVFDLAQGDKVFVKISESQVLTSSPHENYFGLYLI